MQQHYMMKLQNKYKKPKIIVMLLLGFKIFYLTKH